MAEDTPTHCVAAAIDALATISIQTNDRNLRKKLLAYDDPDLRAKLFRAGKDFAILDRELSPQQLADVIIQLQVLDAERHYFVILKFLNDPPSNLSLPWPNSLATQMPNIALPRVAVSHTRKVKRWPLLIRWRCYSRTMILR